MRYWIASLHPRENIAPGRYLLDDDGRLQPLRYRSFVRACAIVTVRPKPAPPTKAEIQFVPPVEGDPLMEEFGVALAKVRARRTSEQQAEGPRLAAAFQARAAAAKPKPAQRPKRQAQSNEECVHCGIPGFRGCDHFLPYEPEVAR